MTLILAFGGRDFTVLACDRLLTKDDGSDVKRYDEEANKTIVYCGVDGIVALAYTGLAYIGDIPTDQRLVSDLTGFQPIKFMGKTLATGGGRHGHFHRWGMRDLFLEIAKNLNQIYEDLKPRLDARGLSLLDHTMVLASGWRWDRRGRGRPILVKCYRDPGAGQFVVDPLPRDWWLRRRGEICLWAAPALAGRLPADFDEQSMTRLRAARGPEETEAVLVDLTRQAAGWDPHIGRDVLLVTLSRPYWRTGLLRYVPDVVAETDPVPAPHFTPWLIGTNVVHFPSVLAGQFNIPLPPYRIRMIAPSDEHTIVKVDTYTRPGP